MPDYRPYPEYQDSGIDWLGNMPAHWQIKQLKRTIDACVNGIWGTESENDENDTIVIRVADFDRSRLKVSLDEPTLRKISEKEKKNRALKKHDLLLEKSGGGEKTLVGQVVLFDHDAEAVTSNFVAKMTPLPEHDGAYLNYVFSKLYDEKVNYCSIKQNTGIQNLDSSAYLAEKFAFPPKAEQCRIATFLDRETAKIDQLIAKQQQLIELLKEKRQAVISHAVTKGLNPDVKMKDSGVEWLGDVPEHWAVCALNYRYEVLLGKMLDEKRITGKHLAPYLRNVDVQWGKINVDDLPEMDFKGDDLVRYSLKKSDLLVCEGGDVGRSAIWDDQLEECYYQKALHRLRARNESRDTTKFMFHVLYSAAQTGLFIGSEGKATIVHLTAETLRRHRFAFPPLSEQKTIATYLKQQNEKFDALMAKAKRQIGLLRERRAALISAAVTGKIDVRDWQPSMEKVA